MLKSPGATTYKEDILSSNCLAAFYGLVLAIRVCRKNGMGVKMEVGSTDAALDIWKDIDGNVTFFDRETMKHILSITI